MIESTFYINFVSNSVNENIFENISTYWDEITIICGIGDVSIKGPDCYTSIPVMKLFGL